MPFMSCAPALPVQAPPNYGFKLTSRLAALARVHLGPLSLPMGQRGLAPATFNTLFRTPHAGATAGSQLNPVR
jgi:hypothetical protein